MNPLVAILLCTYNGTQFLREQLDSIEAQSYTNWVVWASDDGSKDDTLEILRSYQKRWGKNKLHITAGPRAGRFAANFLSQIKNEQIQADYYAYSDQDDIWFPEKIERALTRLQNFGSTVPALYCSRTKLVDEQGRLTGMSPLFRKRPSFPNALVQSLAGGNTMVFSHVARQVIMRTGECEIISHDWWTYILISGVNGQICYDTQASLNYRQHSSNQIGSNTGTRARLLRIRQLLESEFKLMVSANLEALEPLVPLLTEKNQKTLAMFIQARNAPFGLRLVYMLRSGIFRQTLLGNLGLIVAAVFNKI